MDEARPDPDAPQDGETPLARTRATAIVLASAMFMVSIDSTVLVTALPRMARDFGVPATMLSTTITVYILVSAVMLPVSTWIAEQVGPRRVFMVAMAGFALASVGCGLAGSLPTFLVMRALQAAAGSLMVPVGNLVLLKITPRRYMVNAMAISSTPALIAPVVGPPIGGFITSFLAWPWVFYINLPIALCGIVAARRYIPRVPPEPRKPFDLFGFLLVAAMVSALIVGLDLIGTHGIDWRIGAVLVAIGLALTSFVVRHSRRADHPIVSLRPLRHPCFAAAVAGAGNFIRVPFTANGFVLPLMLQIGLGLSAFQAGLLLLAQNAGDLALKPVASRALRTFGFRNALVWGSVMQAAALGLCGLLNRDMPFLLLFVLLFLVGMARSILFTAMQVLRFADMPPDELGAASVLGNLSDTVTRALAISAVALLIDLMSGGAHQPGQTAFQHVLFLLAGIGLLAAPLFARLHPDAGAEVSGRSTRGLRAIREAPEADNPT